MNIQPPQEDNQRPWLDEHDACALIANVRKGGRPTHGNVKRTMAALSRMGHRTGEVAGEGDGCGVLTDLPRAIWSRILARIGQPPELANDPHFFVLHAFLPQHNTDGIVRRILEIAALRVMQVVYSAPGDTRPEMLGPLARAQEPVFWQIAGSVPGRDVRDANTRLFEFQMEIERELPLHVVSCSTHSAVYKVRGHVDTLYKYYPDLRNPEYESTIAIGHSRYSTNTETAFERVQPFSLLGHNGEINTIARLRQEARMLGAQLVEGGSDSQDLNRLIEVLIHRYGFTLLEALEVAFPPVPHEASALTPEQSPLYRRYRMGWGPFAQGPAALVTRFGDECVFSVDALGLRPLWFGETEKDYFFSSEQGVVPLTENIRDPRPLSPGEKIALTVHRGSGVRVLEYRDVRQDVLRRARALRPVKSPELHPHAAPVWTPPPAPGTGNLDGWRSAAGWYRADRDIAADMAEKAADPIGSLGYDGPLAALSTDGPRNLSEYFKEAVAVVTNPSIDRERETEHFSTESIVGPRPALHEDDPAGQIAPIPLQLPVLVGGAFAGEPLLAPDDLDAVARKAGTWTFENVLAAFNGHVAVLDASLQPGETTYSALERLAAAAVDHAKRGVRLLALDDALAFHDGHGWLDHHLALAVVDRALRLQTDHYGRSLRRACGIIVRAAGVRNLHDLILAVALGADAVNPYLLIETAVGRTGEPSERAARLANLLSALEKGLQKVTSTMGVHELRGYGKTFGSIGLSTPVAEIMGCVNYAGSEARGLTWAGLDADSAARAEFLGGKGGRPLKETRIYPHVYKMAGQVAQGEVDYRGLMDRLAELERSSPVALRHTLGFRTNPDSTVDPDEVDLGVGRHSLPFVIASMSFGSQSEIAFRAYAEAAFRLDMYSLNGEGGEIKDMLGKYPHHRGQQIASGRFGVNAELLNSSYLLEIKVGQGAKPGEGGHLPGKKVSAKVAAARNANVGVDLISPSNNHDIYSIEDLAQFIEELKTSNPRVKVAVKIPVVPGIGVIAVGVAKANADIINITGYDGGTGAARQHSLKYVGLPAEIGVVEAHAALLRAGLRERVEIWCDGGMKSGTDVVKMVLLGANRVGFGTMAMVAIGCTICRKCQTDTCHVGITTQVETREQAIAHGLKAFEPQVYEDAVDQLVQLFGAIAQEAQLVTAQLGYTRLQDLVGRADLLDQACLTEQLDMTPLLQVAPRPERPAVGRTIGRALRRPRNHLTEIISDLVVRAIEEEEDVITYEDSEAISIDRAVGTHLVGALVRRYGFANGNALGHAGHDAAWRAGIAGGHDGHAVSAHSPHNHSQNGNKRPRTIRLNFNGSAVPGNGLAAFHGGDVEVVVEGGSQDGMGKCALGGRVAVLKGMNHKGVRIGGGVGKSFAYGAQRGQFFIQGSADSRAGVRLSGADLVIGGEITERIRDEDGFLASRANVKGFAFEYMTAGRAVVLGDPGPWICSGMTGGVVYIRLRPELGFDEAAIKRRLAKGANVKVLPVGPSDEANLHDLLCAYREALADANQHAEARRIDDILMRWDKEFLRVVPANLQVDQTIATE
ncbi:MAG: alpha-hydroxy-acid oxidizing protein [Anaerolineae bacterium]|nr:alpha-hydroxy-acid oxidizing protein [Anaerolineae bacterium]